MSDDPPWYTAFSGVRSAFGTIIRVTNVVPKRQSISPPCLATDTMASQGRTAQRS